MSAHIWRTPRMSAEHQTLSRPLVHWLDAMMDRTEILVSYCYSSNNCLWHIMVYLLWNTPLEENNLYFAWCVFSVAMFCLSVNYLIVTRYLHSTAVRHSCHEVLNWCLCRTVIDPGKQTTRMLMCGLVNEPANRIWVEAVGIGGSNLAPAGLKSYPWNWLC